MNRPRKLALAIALALAGTAVTAASLETKGLAVQAPSPLGTYGMGVPTKSALKTLVPKDWKVFVHKSAALPPTIDWELQDTWASVLTRLASANNLAILLDGDARTVLIRTPEVALEEAGTRKEIEQAAVTPLPKFTEAKAKVEQTPELSPEVAVPAVEPPAQVAATPTTLPSPATPAVTEAVATPLAAVPALAVGPVQAQSAPGSQSASPAPSPEPTVTVAAEKGAELPVIRANPTPEMVVRAEQATSQLKPTYISTDEFSYSAAVAHNKPTLRAALNSFGQRHGLRVIWLASAEPQLKGPVTFLGQDPHQDMTLLRKALGRSAAVSFDFDKLDGVVWGYDTSVSAAQARQQVRADVVQYRTRRVTEVAAVSPDSPQATPAGAGAASGTAKASALTASAKSNPTASAPMASGLTLAVNQKQPLEDALNTFAKQNGYTMDWRIEGGFEANRAMAYSGATVAQVLAQVLPSLNLSADVYTRDKHIIIRPGDTRN